MKHSVKKLFWFLLLGVVLFGVTGCTNLMEEDPNDQQIPWATPADWENQVPGMPSSGTR